MWIRVSAICRTTLVVGLATVPVVSEAGSLMVERAGESLRMVSQSAYYEGDVAVFGSDYFLALIGTKGSQTLYYSPRRNEASSSDPSNSSTPAAYSYSGRTEARTVASGGLAGPGYLLLGSAGGIVIGLDAPYDDATAEAASTTPAPDPETTAALDVLSARGSIEPGATSFTETQVTSGSGQIAANAARATIDDSSTSGPASTWNDSPAADVASTLSPATRAALGVDAPEPGSVILTTCGLALVAVLSRRRLRRN